MAEANHPEKRGESETCEIRGDDIPKFADVVLSSLKSMGWSVGQFGIVYGKAIKNSPYTKERIYQMIREDNFPRDPYRRWIIARLLQISPALLGLSSIDDLLDQASLTSRHVPASIPTRYQPYLDLEEFQTKLKLTESAYKNDAVVDALYELTTRLKVLHDAVLYSGSQATPIKKLICSYQMALGNVLRNQFHMDEATRHLSLAVILAKEEGFVDLYVKALIRRGVLFLDRGKTTPNDAEKAAQCMKLALHDFEEARGYLDQVGLPQREDVLLLGGTTRAYLSLDRTDITQAMKDVDAAGKIIHQSKANEQGLYYLDRASAFIAPPISKLHNTAEAFDALREATRYIDASIPRRYAYLHITEALVHFDKGWYPTATELASEALVISQAGMNIARIATLYELLKESSYGKSSEVAELDIELLHVQNTGLK